MTEKELLLICVGEECNEVAQECSKALRFGMGEQMQGHNLNNSQRLLYEFNQLAALLELLYEKPITELFDIEIMDSKKLKFEHYKAYSEHLGIL